MQMPYELLPQWFTVKALAQRWGVDRDHIAAMIGSGLIETVASIRTSTNWKNKFGGEDVHASPPGMYTVLSSGAWKGLDDAGNMGPPIPIYWQNSGAASWDATPAQHSPSFLLPTKKKELSSLVFNFLAGELCPSPTNEPVLMSFRVYGVVSEFLINKYEVRRIEDAATQKEIQDGDVPKAIASRRIMLTVINALCGRAEIDPRGRNATTEIMRLLDEQGTPAAERTVRDAIKQIPDAMKTRKTEQ
ncbi:hypothetical protein [Thiomonas sp.]